MTKKPIDELDLDLEDLEEVEETVTPMPDVAKVAKQPKEPKEPKQPKEPRIGEGQIGVADIAAMLGVPGRELRAYLRKNGFRDVKSDQKGKTYVWTKGSEEAQAIIDGFKAAKASPRVTTEKTKKPANKATKPAVVLEDLDLEDEEE